MSVKVDTNISVGNSDDLMRAKGFILNVANDLEASYFLSSYNNKVEYSQVGLIDGPGNSLTIYYAAVLTLAALQKRGEVMVGCHSGTRALTVAIMFLNTKSQRGWGDWFALLEERLGFDLPRPHDEHRKAFEKMEWTWLSTLVEDE